MKRSIRRHRCWTRGPNAGDDKKFGGKDMHGVGSEWCMQGVR